MLTIVLMTIIAIETANHYYLEDPTSHEKRIEKILKDSAISSMAPKIVIFGTSRAAFGINGKTLGKAFDYHNQGEVVNTAFPGLGINSWHKIKAGLDISELKVAIIAPDDYFFFTTMPTAPIPERSIKESFEKYIDKMLLIFTQQYSYREKIKWLKYHIKAKLKLAQEYSLNWTYKEDSYWYSDEEANYHMLDPVFANTNANNIAALYYNGKNNELDSKSIKEFEDFITELPNTNVFIILMPIHHLYKKALLDNKNYAHLHLQYNKMIKSVAMKFKNVIIIDLESASNLNDKDFVDSVHLSNIGRDKISNHLYKKLKMH